MKNKLRFLTGITPSGTPHLGNYVGSIRPAVQASHSQDVQSYYFLSDYHALIKCGEPERIHRSTLEIAATWLAAGLDPEHVTFYRQSDLPDVTELMWMLSCVTGKGLLNRAHAYKAAVDKSLAQGEEPDADVTAGLYMYPVLMAADILIFRANKVPVGRDQLQHLEMTRDIAQRFNFQYGDDLLVLPEAVVDDNVATLPGLDGRKMSKSYNNTIALFAPRRELQKLIAGIITDSRAPGEAKEVEGSPLFEIYQAFATPEETAAMRRAYADGIAWGDVKNMLFERIDKEVAPMRWRYEALMAEPQRLEDVLQAGAVKARVEAKPYVRMLREAVGLRSLVQGAAVQEKAPAKVKAALPQFRQYREADGLFYFKLMDGQGRLLVQGRGFESPQEAGKTIAALQMPDADVEAILAAAGELAAGIQPQDVADALKALADAAVAKKAAT